jgi:hypothetical protein
VSSHKPRWLAVSKAVHWGTFVWSRNPMLRVLDNKTDFQSQEKRYRSMQEHIRRAHPDHYIPKLPATEESFQLMINTPPSERPPQPQPAAGAPARRCMFAL